MNDDHDELVTRLQALGRQPLDPATAGRALATARGRQRSGRAGTRLKIGAAAAVGFAAGSLGLATAGALPAPAQRAAHSVLGSVGVAVPPGQQRVEDPTTCPGGPYANHGAYVRAHHGDPKAAQSPCGRPTVSVNHPDGTAGDTAGGSSRQGPPPWAHGHGKGHANGGPGHADGGAGDDTGDDQAPAAGPATTAAPTTVPRTTTSLAPTTTAAPTTTTTSTTSSTTSTTER
jgi:hypothetical protein